MTNTERLLIDILNDLDDKSAKERTLRMYLEDEEPLSNEAKEVVNELMNND